MIMHYALEQKILLQTSLQSLVEFTFDEFSLEAVIQLLMEEVESLS